MSEKPPALLWAWVAGQFSVLVPKKRGKGFLRVPLGHHHDAGLAAVAEVAGCDLYGLDGSLDFQVSMEVYHSHNGKREAFAKKVLPALEAHYGWPTREVTSVVFYANHPCLNRAGANGRVKL